MAEEIGKIAEGAEDADPEFKEQLNMYLGLIERGASIKAAKRVMDWYVRE